MEKNLLFYKFIPVADPEITRDWQTVLCTLHGLKGRVIVAAMGINATLSGPVAGLKAYVRAMNQSRDFRGIEYKWTPGSAADYPRLSVKVRPELVTLAPGESFDVFSPGRGLKPKEWHEYLAAHPEVTILDARNAYESAIGVFPGPNLITPPIQAFRQIKAYVEKLPRDQPVLTYCTGDIRCEYLSAWMRHKGFREVYHLDGGIVKYGELYKDKGYWNGKCFVFDKRMSLAFSPESPDIGSCTVCGKPTSSYVDQITPSGEILKLVCAECQAAAMAVQSDGV